MKQIPILAIQAMDHLNVKKGGDNIISFNSIFQMAKASCGKSTF